MKFVPAFWDGRSWRKKISQRYWHSIEVPPPGSCHLQAFTGAPAMGMNMTRFTQIGGNELGLPSRYIRNFSCISVQSTGSDAGNYFLYVSAGDNAQPLAIFRQKNN